MKTLMFAFLSVALFCGIAASQVTQNFTQRQDRPKATAPVYSVTVIGRTIQAVNYGHRSEPTKIDFRGTVLEPTARGEAKVEAQRGVTVIDAKFERLSAPGRYGTDYLTYVLWAITPEGRPINLGEIVLNPSNKAEMHVSSPFQAFGLVVTAEPFYAVTQPSDVVVMENVVRPDTIGKIEVVAAKYDLLPRAHYTFDRQAAENQPEGRKVSMSEYESVLAIYQAQNAVQIAKSEGADRYASDSLAKAEQLLREAESIPDQKADSKRIVMTAREATQAAEDARTITAKRAQDERLTNEQSNAEPAGTIPGNR